MDSSSPSTVKIETSRQLRLAALLGELDHLCACKDMVQELGNLIIRFGVDEVQHALDIACKCNICKTDTPIVPPPPPPPKTEDPPPIKQVCWLAPPPPREYQGENNGY